MKILIVKLSSIGDVVHALPALYALRNAYRSAKIDWLVEEEPSSLLIGCHLLDEVLVIKKNGWFRDFKGTCRTAKKLRAKNYDMVIDFQGLLKSGIWVFLSKGKRRIGFDKSREMSYLFLNEKLPAYNPDKHAVDRYLDMVRYLGAECGGALFPIPISEREKKKIIGLLKAHGIWEGIPFVVVNQAARWDTKLWSAEKFAVLCNEIADRFGRRAVIVGAPNSKQNKEIISLAGSKVADLSGKTTLKELAYLMSLSDAVITVDSGPMHIAAAMNVTVVALFGPTAPWRTGPYGEGHAVIRKEVQCSPCFSKVCRDTICMKNIEVEDVLKAVEKKLQKAKEAAGGLSGAI